MLPVLLYRTTPYLCHVLTCLVFSRALQDHEHGGPEHLTEPEPRAPVLMYGCWSSWSLCAVNERMCNADTVSTCTLGSSP